MMILRAGQRVGAARGVWRYFGAQTQAVLLAATEGSRQRSDGSRARASSSTGTATVELGSARAQPTGATPAYGGRASEGGPPTPASWRAGGRVPTPAALVEAMDAFVVGQPHAKRVLAVAVHNHYLRLAHEAARRSVEDESAGEERAGRGGFDAAGEEPGPWQAGRMGSYGETGRSSGGLDPEVFGESRLNSRGAGSGNAPGGGGTFGESRDRLGMSITQRHPPSSPPPPDMPEELLNVELEKSNVLLLGPSGCGKTLLARTLARVVDVPFAMADATTLTQAGYVGEDVESVLFKLYAAANYDAAAAQCGIVFLDEVDKIARRGEGASLARDVSGEGVQQAMLRMLEGAVVSVPDKGARKGARGDSVLLDTTHILFLCAGAFVGLDRIVADRLAAASIGFGARVRARGPLLDRSKRQGLLPGRSDEGGRSLSAPPPPEAAEAETVLGSAVPSSVAAPPLAPFPQHTSLLRQVDHRDLIAYGLIPEFVGRLPVVAPIEPLSREDLVHVLTQPRNAVARQFAAGFARCGARFRLTPGGARAVAALADRRGVGARGLRGLLEGLLLDAMFRAPGGLVEGIVLHACEEQPEVLLCEGPGSFGARLQELGLDPSQEGDCAFGADAAEVSSCTVGQ